MWVGGEWKERKSPLPGASLAVEITRQPKFMPTSSLMTGVGATPTTQIEETTHEFMLLNGSYSKSHLG
ncbi:hypothetical protein SCA6_015549 [Theobroma cacao]